MYAVPAFQIDQYGRERFVGEDQAAGRPAAIIAGGNLGNRNPAGLRIEQDPFVGPQQDRTFTVRGQDTDAARLKDRFGIASTGPVTGVELRTEYLDLHDLHIDDEGMGGIVPDLKKGFAVEPDPTDSGIECFGIAQTTVAVEPDPRPVGKRELALAASGRDQAHRRGAFIPRTQEQVFPADDERQQGRSGRKTPQGYEPALLSGPVQHVDPVVYVGEFMAVIAFRRPGEQFLPGLKKRCVLRSLSAGAVIHRRKRRWISSGISPCRKSRTSLLILSVFIVWGAAHNIERRKNGEPPAGKNDFQKKSVIEASRRRSWPSAAVIWFSTVLTLIRSRSAISRFERPS